MKCLAFPGENAGFITHGDLWDVEGALGSDIPTISDLRSRSSISRMARCPGLVNKSPAGRESRRNSPRSRLGPPLDRGVLVPHGESANAMKAHAVSRIFSGALCSQREIAPGGSLRKTRCPSERRQERGALYLNRVFGISFAPLNNETLCGMPMFPLLVLSFSRFLRAELRPPTSSGFEWASGTLPIERIPVRVRTPGRRLLSPRAARRVPHR